ncbi:MAG: hypothetical protein ACRD1T_04375 [Acidimicrobiia bacterium]
MLNFRTLAPTPSQAQDLAEQPSNGAWMVISDDGAGKSPAAWVTYGEPASGANLDKKANVADSMTTSERHDVMAHDDRAAGTLPTFTIHLTDTSTLPWSITRPEPGRPAGEEAYSVSDSQGRVLGRIRKGRSPLGLRRAWSIELADSKEPIRGYRGTLVGWLSFSLFLPVWIPLTLLSVVYALISSDSWDCLTWEPPKRTKWRKRGGNPLSQIILERRASGYRREDSLLDVRLAYAQAILNSYY